MRTRALAVGAALGLVAGIAFVVPAAAGGDDDDHATYSVRIVNLTFGQPLTPPVVATHSGGYKAFRVGRPASLGVQEIAENGRGSFLLAELAAERKVADSLQTTTGPLVPKKTPGASPPFSFDDEVTFTIESWGEANRLTFVSMLICTNDGFTGTQGVKLPEKLGHERSFLTMGYDAGTEINTEDLADIVPPCQDLMGVEDDMGDTGSDTTDPALAEGGVIHHHPGIAGGSDLEPDVHGWEVNAPVALVEVERIA